MGASGMQRGKQSISTGEEMLALLQRLYPICRSITGAGVRDTLGILREILPIRLHEVPSGTKVFDWVVPLEWNIRGAYIKDRHGRTLVDFRDHTLHVVSYSTPIEATLDLDDLKEHLFTLPQQPQLIPYKTAYYKENWGFCLTHERLSEFTDGPFDVVIDSTLELGHLTYGELILEGESPEQVLLYTHVCHPSLCNDNLSGMVVVTALAEWLQQRKNRYTYRIVWAPGTIGAITWLSVNESRLDAIKHGLVASLLGDRGCIQYKKSRRGDAEIDRVVEYVLARNESDYRVRDFIPYGYDERQFCSPGIDLPVGRLTRTPNSEYPEYHTSGDDLDFVTKESLADSLAVLMRVIETLEKNHTYRSLNPKCEPQLGKRGLYGSMGGAGNTRDWEMALLWVLNLADGRHSLLDMAQRSGVDFELLEQAAHALVMADLLVLD